ncbi:MAG: hypothetical protein IJ673_02620 [Treponema sp.]|nr:hypothetical protein [Treponema sp.]
MLTVILVPPSSSISVSSSAPLNRSRAFSASLSLVMLGFSLLRSLFTPVLSGVKQGDMLYVDYFSLNRNIGGKQGYLE